MQPKSLAWKSEWRAKIGGSRSAAAAGVHEYMTPLQLYKSMVDGAEFDPEENPDMLRGVLMEPIALQRLKMMYADLYFEPHDQDSFVYNEKYPFASDLPDGWVAHDGARIPVQIKVPRPENWRKLDEHIPAYIQCNCIHSCALNNSPAILLACLNPVTMEVYRNVYEPAQDVTQALMDAEERFFTEHVIPRVPPPPRTAGDMRMLWPEHAPGKRVTATNDIAGAHAKLLRLKPEAKERVDRIESLNLMIKAFMGDAELLVDERGQLLATWRSTIVNALDAKQFRDELPNVYARYTKDRRQRTFLPKTTRVVEVLDDNEVMIKSTKIGN